MVGLGIVWRLRWKFFVMLLCVPVSAAHVMARASYPYPGDAAKGVQAAGGFLIFGGFLAGVLKGVGFLVRAITRRPRPAPQRSGVFFDKASNKAGIAALVFAFAGGYAIPAGIAMFITSGLAATALVLGFIEARQEIAAESNGSDPAVATSSVAPRLRVIPIGIVIGFSIIALALVTLFGDVVEAPKDPITGTEEVKLPPKTAENAPATAPLAETELPSQPAGRSDAREQQTAHWQDFTWELSRDAAMALAREEGLQIDQDPERQPLNGDPDDSYAVFRVPVNYTDYSLTSVTLAFEKDRLRSVHLKSELVASVTECLRPGSPINPECDGRVERVFQDLRGRLVARYGPPTTCMANRCVWDESGITLKSAGSPFWSVGVNYMKYSRSEWMRKFRARRDESEAARASRSKL